MTSPRRAGGLALILVISREIIIVFLKKGELEMGKKQLVIPDVPINGFCYSYAKALLGKLKELLDDNGIFVDPAHSVGTNRNNKYEEPIFEMTLIAQTVVYLLEEQFASGLRESIGKNSNKGEIEEFVALAEEFLSIFQK